MQLKDTVFDYYRNIGRDQQYLAGGIPTHYYCPCLASATPSKTSPFMAVAI